MSNFNSSIETKSYLEIAKWSLNEHSTHRYNIDEVDLIEVLSSKQKK